MLTYGAYLANRKTQRGGVIPYTIVNERVYFLLARHGETNELGDFGGGIKKNEFALNGAFREYKEETNGIFAYSSCNDFLDKLAIIDGNKMAVIFIPVNKTWMMNNSARRAFHSVAENPKKSFNEISDVVWVEESKFVNLVMDRNLSDGTNDKLWILVRKFFQKIRIREITDALKMKDIPRYMVNERVITTSKGDDLKINFFLGKSTNEIYFSKHRKISGANTMALKSDFLEVQMC